MKYFLIAILFGIIACGNPTENITTSNVTDSPSQVKHKMLPKLDSTRYNVGFLIMDGVYNTELTAPFDIFQHTVLERILKR